MSSVPSGVTNPRLRIRARIDWVPLLPDGRFFTADVDNPHIDDAKMKTLHNARIVEVVENGQPNVWRVTELAREIWQRERVDGHGDGSLVLPCGHGGMENRADGYYCGFEPCEDRFTRAEVEACL